MDNEIYKLLHNIGPSSLCTQVQAYEPNRPLRSSNQLNLKKTKTCTKFAERDQLIRGVRYWDLLDHETRSAETLGAFKARTRKCDNFYLPGFMNYCNLNYTL